ncbi:LacI family transcriptional regulator [Thermopolyspora flexuosa]|jgi:DNA-binding LacI/PurR family transcriptional regulator|uniref:DNA-binding LacI/PurR family transcriptional regulator n=1 Tax=Thermopolyspora flexuosa TaxID=103836 RepID=A0A543IS42_9ACTN|nr:LacI family DNA-binding transcriptional regulator [Thermopolyspora flexuosa]TQM73401.1 DNA-binding LacI/PurR family transcriptional regulator [Thermopolyspora flexuosa]GGM80806.1 LacI family transcriptional regulator [Thermopolyspora flexuosa]
MAEQPTLAQVAAAAGVSPATASRVLTGSVRVSTSARRQVHEAISRLGYVRRRAPRGSSPRRSDRLVAAVVCDPIHRVFAEPFYARLLAAIEDALGKNGIATMVMSAAATTVSTVATPLVAGAVSGVLLVGARSGHPLAVTLAASGVPVRCIGRPPDGLEMPFIDVDNADGARQAAEHLLLQGRRHITMIGGSANLPAARQRIDGFRTRLNEAGVHDVPVAYGDFTHASGVHATRWLLQRMPNLDAIFAASDTMAAAAINVLRETGRKVPDDVAVIGFDDVPLARHTRPPLTTVRQPIEDLAAVGVRLLLSGISGSTPDQNPILPAELVVRESA